MAAVNVALEAICSAVTGMLLLSSITQHSSTKEHRNFIGTLSALLLMLTSDLVSWCIPEANGCEAVAYTVVSVTYISGYAGTYFFMRYLNEFVKGRTGLQKLINRFLNILCALSVLAILINPFFGFIFKFAEGGHYEMGALYVLSNVYPVAALAAATVFICAAPNLCAKERLVFLTYPFFPLIGLIADDLLGNSVFVSVGSFLSVLAIYIQLYAQRGKQIAEQEKELISERMSIMLSQIQPHFLYNSLNAIYYLCEADPPAAQRAIEGFSTYLRGNLDSLKRTTPVPFDKELDHVRIYLSLEKMRFENDLNIVYEIGTTAFMLPALTVQPLVENAVKYGVGKKKGGGTVCIKTAEYADFYEITVSDDGVGYDPNATQDDGRTHIGIDNVRSRLAVMCRGTLEIETCPGDGTTAVIRIPRDGVK